MAPPIDKIDGDPEGMQRMNTRGLEPINPTLEYKGFMDEAMAFAAKDQAACKALSNFVTDADLGLRAYNNQARAHGQGYLSSDSVSAAKLQNVTTGIYTSGVYS
jgi:hypothetical protein